MNAILAARAELQPPTAKTDHHRGVDYAQVDPSTRETLHTLFSPRSRGYAFFCGLLANATVRPYTSPHLPKEIRGDVAIVNVKGYAALCQRIGLSYDTTHMYMLIMRTLGMLYVEKRDGQMTIILPLSAYHPPAGLAETLLHLRDRYRSRRPKIGRIVSAIIGRLDILIQPEGIKADHDQPASLQYAETPVLAELLSRVQRALAIQNVTDPNGHIATGIVEAVAPLVATHNDRTYAPRQEEVHSSLSQTHPESAHRETGYLRESSPAENEKRVEERTGNKNLPTAIPTTDERLLRAADRGTVQPRTSGRFPTSNLAIVQQRGARAPQKSTCNSASPVKNSRFRAEHLPNHQRPFEATEKSCTGMGRFGSENLPLKIDSEILSLNGIGNGECNINFISLSHPDSVPDPVKADGKRRQSPQPYQLAHAKLIHQAKALAKLIEGSEENVGAYIVLIKQHHPRTLRAAVIATLQRKHCQEGRGALKKPGGYYTRQVQKYQHAIPQPMMTLVQTYEQASYEEIDAAFATQAHMQPVKQGLASSAQQGTIRPKRGARLCKATAEALALRIPQEDSSVEVRGLREEEGTYGVRVFIAPVEHLFASVEDWECYHAQMQMLEHEESAI